MNILSEENNSYLKRSNQEMRYAKNIWPIPELKDDIEYYTDSEIGKMIAKLAFKFHSLYEENERLSNQIKRSKDEIREEFQKELDRLEEVKKNSIYFSKLERDRYDDFFEKHYHSCGARERILRSVGTGVGTAYEVECPICGKKENITDYDLW